MVILTNFERFPAQWTATNGQSGTSEFARTFGEFTERMAGAGVILINCDASLALRLSALFLLCPWKRKKLVAVDFVLRRPKTLPARAATVVKRVLFSRIGLFIHYFQDITGYEKYFGIGRDRSVFVPFKPNLRYRLETEGAGEGRYILCLGRSMRDYDTFFRAMEQLPYPAAIPEPNFAQLAIHESRYTIPPPANVELLKDEGGEEAMLRMMRGARLLALPILKTSLCASGVSTYLNAMLMRRCVVLTDGPGASDVLTDQALICPPEDPAALAAVIRSAWEDDELRSRTVEAGYRYALALGGEPELRQRVIDAVCAWSDNAAQPG